MPSNPNIGRCSLTKLMRNQIFIIVILTDSQLLCKFPFIDPKYWPVLTCIPYDCQVKTMFKYSLHQSILTSPTGFQDTVWSTFIMSLKGYD